MAKDNSGNPRKAFTADELNRLTRSEKTKAYDNIQALYQGVVDFAMEELERNKDNFKKRFSNYYNYWKNAETALSDKDKKILSIIRKSNTNLGIYSRNSEDKSFDLRFQGKPIATIKTGKSGIQLDERENTIFPTSLKQGLVTEDTITSLQNLTIQDDDDEKKVEFQILEYINSNNGLRYVTPITKPDKIAYIQFPSAFKASRAHDKLANVNFSDPARGRGIDILARQKGNTLLAIEVKDNYETNEQPEDAIKQAILYCCEMSYLVRLNDDWFRKLLLNKDPNKSLLIKATIAMPYPEDREKLIADYQIVTNSNERRRLHINTGKRDSKGKEITDTIELHYLFFKKPNKGENIDYSTFSTSLK